MCSTAGPIAASMTRPKASRVWLMLARKEWHEQRWRFFLGTIVLTGMLAGMLRAQIIPPGEAAVAIYWPVGVVLAVFLAMGPVATERAHRTWEFLVAQPVSRSDVLFLKWGVGLIQLVVMMVIATVVGSLALWSREFHGPATLLGSANGDGAGMVALPQPAGQLSVAWLGKVAVPATIALASWYTPMFWILTRARNEFTAALGGLLLTIALHVWLAQFIAVRQTESLIVPAMLNPLAPIVLLIDPRYSRWLSAVCLLDLVIWIALPVLLMRHTARRATVK
jgi:hypothetical protein